MKALKSKLTKEILSDPSGKQQLRIFLASKKIRSATTGQFIVGRSKTGEYRVKASVVTKAT